MHYRYRPNETKNWREKSSEKRCYPYEYGIETDEYTYTQNTSLSAYENNKHPNIQVFTQNKIFGKTLEYQIAFENPECKLLITPSLKNSDELKNLMDAFADKKELEIYLTC